MKLNFKTFMIAFALIAATSACKKDNKGCKDAASVNYDSDAKEDDGSCSYPGDNFSGEWKVIETEKVTGDSTHSTATITKIDNQNVKIVSSRKNGPVYHLEEYTIPMDWETKKIVKTGTTITGTITDKNNFEVVYLYGSGATTYSVKLKYTR